MSWVRLRCGFPVVFLFLCLQSWIASVKLYNACGVYYGAVVCLDSLLSCTIPAVVFDCQLYIIHDID
jgi:hypothetical protein